MMAATKRSRALATQRIAAGLPVAKEDAACVIQSGIRGALWRRRVKREADQELMFIGMKPKVCRAFLPEIRLAPLAAATRAWASHGVLTCVKMCTGIVQTFQVHDVRMSYTCDRGKECLCARVSAHGLGHIPIEQSLHDIDATVYSKSLIVTC